MTEEIIEAKELKGLSGWLAWFSFGVVLTPPMLAYNLINGFDEGIRSSGGSWLTFIQNMTSWPTTLALLPYWWVSWFSVGLVGWSGANVVLLFRHHRRFPVSWIVFQLVMLVVMVVEGDLSQDVFRTMMVTAAWAAYLLSSKRVRNTFVQE
jgi:Protein of unknown function (DUF2569)